LSVFGGLRVLDLGQYYQGPYAGLLLAMGGADVVKVEPPGGEPLRRRFGGGTSYPQALLNSNKRSLAIDLKQPHGVELLGRLAECTDVLIENFAPGVTERLGIAAAKLCARNPRLVYASGTGFGSTGPDRDALALDVVVQAVAGVMDVTGQPDGPPTKAGPQIADFLSGTHLYGAIVTALYERERTGAGRHVEVAMQDAVYPSLTSNLGSLHYRGPDAARRTGSRHGGVAVTPYNVYEAADGHVAIICTTEDHWQRLCRAMERPDLLEDPRFASNRVRVENLLETDEVVLEWTRPRKRDELTRALRREAVPAGPVRDLLEVMHDPGLHERGMLEWIEHPEVGRMAVPRSPMRFEGEPLPELRPSPRLGEHAEEVLVEWLGMSGEEVDALERASVLKQRAGPA
jgi:crotonobetainyl-CoA:carnitine CoA-transferase CaiB-like acyl-CoA transferase